MEWDEVYSFTFFSSARLKSSMANLLKGPRDPVSTKNGLLGLKERSVEEHLRLPFIPLRVLGDN